MKIYENLDLFKTEENLFLAPRLTSDAPNNCYLKISRSNAEVSVTSKLPGTDTKSHLNIYGLIGMIGLSGAKYLLLATDREFAGEFLSHKVWKITGSEIMKVESHDRSQSQEAANKVYVDMLKAVIKQYPFYYSTTYNMTESSQKNKELEAKDKYNVSKMFCWNHYMLKQFSKCLSENTSKAEQIDQYMMRIMCGYVRFLKPIVRETILRLCLISRISFLRPGIRYNSRGADKQGNTSNMVESEQILVVPGRGLYSFVQIRGSVPLIWQQKIDGSYRPKITIGDEENNKKVITQHFDNLKSHYKFDVHVISLLDVQGYELPLGNQYKKLVCECVKNTGFVEFDFHKTCANGRWDKVNTLITGIDHLIETAEYFFLDENMNVKKMQQMSFRTNCLDCLDRTNVIQKEISKKVLELQLIDANIIRKEETLDKLQELEFVHRIMWADNADEISKSYSGTRALKTDYTRTKKRSRKGVILDLCNSVVRHCKNNYMDGHIHDSLSLFSGRFRVQKTDPKFMPRARSGVNEITLLFLRLAACLVCSAIIGFKFKISKVPIVNFSVFVISVVTLMRFFVSSALRKVSVPLFEQKFVDPDEE